MTTLKSAKSATKIDTGKLSELYPAWRSRMAVLAAFMRRIDREVVETDFAFAPEDTARDRLFEVLMGRFDALQPHREAIQRIRAGAMRDPIASVARPCAHKSWPSCQCHR